MKLVTDDQLIKCLLNLCVTKIPCAFRKGLIVSQRGHRNTWETSSAFWDLEKICTHIYKIFHPQENLFLAIASYATEIPWILNITSDSAITNIHVWSHISLIPLFSQLHIRLKQFHPDSADSILYLCFQGPTRSSVGATKLSAPRLLAYFWINVWQRASLSLSKRQGIREALAWWEGHTQS